jgi:hypothetical protein
MPDIHYSISFLTHSQHAYIPDQRWRSTIPTRTNRHPKMKRFQTNNPNITSSFQKISDRMNNTMATWFTESYRAAQPSDWTRCYTSVSPFLESLNLPPRIHPFARNVPIRLAPGYLQRRTVIDAMIISEKSTGYCGGRSSPWSCPLASLGAVVACSFRDCSAWNCSHLLWKVLEGKATTAAAGEANNNNKREKTTPIVCLLISSSRVILTDTLYVLEF